MIITDLKCDEIVEFPNSIIGGSSFYSYTNSNSDDMSGLKTAGEKLREIQISSPIQTLQDSIREST
ncbi:MAG: hypothetical protein C6Y22_15015 [Hapalosiphonaceae cyanobacterium JJU2]|nr:MAG: hypothetical protein C6Y22_15015 [Hapalosiphonaceae cyanobacterium JJU2]